MGMAESGGGGGIRTHGYHEAPTTYKDCRLSPLGHASPSSRQVVAAPRQLVHDIADSPKRCIDVVGDGHRPVVFRHGVNADDVVAYVLFQVLVPSVWNLHFDILLERQYQPDLRQSDAIVVLGLSGGSPPRQPVVKVEVVPHQKAPVWEVCGV